MTTWRFWKLFEPALLPRVPGASAFVKPPGGPQALDAMATGHAGRVLGLSCPEDMPDWERWLAEIGFLPGEHVSVIARNPWGGGDPLVVRIGQSTFALRRAEAACVRVQPLTP